MAICTHICFSEFPGGLPCPPPSTPPTSISWPRPPTSPQPDSWHRLTFISTSWHFHFYPDIYIFIPTFTFLSQLLFLHPDIFHFSPSHFYPGGSLNFHSSSWYLHFTIWFPGLDRTECTDLREKAGLQEGTILPTSSELQLSHICIYLLIYMHIYAYTIEFLSNVIIVTQAGHPPYFIWTAIIPYTTYCIVVEVHCHGYHGRCPCTKFLSDWTQKLNIWLFWGYILGLFGVKFGIWKSCLCKGNDKYQVCPLLNRPWNPTISYQTSKWSQKH